MLGRVLFAFVWLIIAAGLVLPLYPRDVVTSVVTAVLNWRTRRARRQAQESTH